ncbi:MAG: Rpn family recombination-promoting nuclease/putative transposase [Clostridiales bacterium]|jgi:predicted transposase/invertase (TIGR01784 family)|nr:Rpn family recombination-promoting nuclease/putative transposase [Clostridiales bacterium]
MDVDGKKVNIEIQNRNEGNFPERVLFHWAKIYSASLPEGENYISLPQTIIISILDFKMFECEEVHSEFKLLETKRHELLSNKQIYHFFELQKLKDLDQLDLESEKDLWLALFNAKTEEELEKLALNGGEVMVQAVEAYKSVTATEEFRNLEWLRTKTAHDEASAIGNAERRGAESERRKWQGVVAEKDIALANERAEVEKLRRQLAALQARN